MDARQFQTRFHRLLDEAAAGVNLGCVQLVHCQRCTASTFCQQSEHLVRCHYCVECKLCTECSHCRGSERLLACHHCDACDGCIASSYLVRCRALSQCTYCFGCVGLNNRDFHILNQPYDRSDYFRITRDLLRQLA